VTTIRAAIGIAAVLLAVTACRDETTPAAQDALSDDAVTVGSFAFPESVLLAELYSQALEDNGIRVVRAFDLGPREFVGPALREGLIELVPEYAGTAVGYFSAGAVTPSAAPQEAHRQLTDVVDGTTITALDSAPAQNANTFVITDDTARRYDLHDLSDVAAVAPELVLGGPAECATRPLCQAGLRDVYKASFADFVALDTGGPVTHQALRSGGVDIALLFSTDPELTDYVELTDDLHLQPAENVTPLVRAEVVERWGADIIEPIDAVSHDLDTPTLRQLNATDATTPGSDDVAAIAASWLRTEGLT
jgi:osmoprotectant transport system substrate-binding protein